MRSASQDRVGAQSFNYAEIHKALHNWAGMGGSFGFPQITEKAREAESLAALPSYEVCPKLCEFFENLLQLFTSATVAKELPPPPAAAAEPPLAGRRVALLNFEPPQLARLTGALKKAGAVCRTVTGTPPDISKRFLRTSDIVICTLPGTDADIAALVRGLGESRKPRLFLGSQEAAKALGLSPAINLEFLPEPWEDHQVIASSQAVIARNAEMTSSIASQKPTVLIGEDENTTRKLIKTTLEESGFICRTADNGRLTLAMARNDPPDAIILDVNMPLMNGFEVLRAIRKLGITQGIPVMLLTGRQDENDIVSGLRCGADDYVVKPFDPQELVARLVRLF